MTNRKQKILETVQKIMEMDEIPVPTIKARKNPAPVGSRMSAPDKAVKKIMTGEDGEEITG
jgi:hypothetical protein